MSEASDLKLIVFDFDGTLVDSQYMITTAMGRAFAAHDIDPPEVSAVRRLVGLPLEAAIEALMPNANGPAEAIAATHRQVFRDMLSDPEAMAPTFDGISELMCDLEGPGSLLGICTGRARPSLERMLSHHGMLCHFTTLQTADRHPGKPHPAMLEAALEEAGIETEGALMIGDTSFDMEMANNAGVLAIGVAWGYHDREELLQAGAASVAADTDVLRSVIQEWAKA